MDAHGEYPRGCLQFLLREFCVENILFWRDGMSYAALCALELPGALPLADARMQPASAGHC